MPSALARALAWVLRLPFKIIFYFSPRLRYQLEPEPHELMEFDKYPRKAHPEIEKACQTLATGLIHGVAPNHVTFHMANDHGRDVVVDVYFIDGLSPAEKIARLEALLEDAGVDNPYTFSRTRLDAWERDPANVR
jgi:hypothetical protein